MLPLVHSRLELNAFFFNWNLKQNYFDKSTLQIAFYRDVKVSVWPNGQIWLDQWLNEIPGVAMAMIFMLDFMPLAFWQTERFKPWNSNLCWIEICLKFIKKDMMLDIFKVKTLEISCCPLCADDGRDLNVSVRAALAVMWRCSCS